MSVLFRTPSRSALLSPLLLAAAGFACGDEGSSSLRLELETAEVDFGQVPVGVAASRQIEVTNRGDDEVELMVRPREGAGPYRFVLSPSRLPPSGVGVLTVTFLPEQAGPASLLVALGETADGRGGVELSLKGTGTEEALLAANPTRVDFRRVSLGTAPTRTVSLTNETGRDMEVELLLGQNVRLCTALEPAAFCVRLLDGNVTPAGSFDLVAGEAATLEVALEPDRAGLGYDGVITLKYCALSACEITLELSGTGVDNALECEPSRLDFGPVNPGAERTLQVQCENRGLLPIVVSEWLLTPDSGEAFLTSQGPATTLNEGERVSIEVGFAPESLGPVTGMLRVETTVPNPAGGDVFVDLVGAGGGPNIEVSPVDGLDFGAVGIGVPTRRSVIVTNSGFSPLSLDRLDVEGEASAAFRVLEALPASISAGARAVLSVEFIPSEAANFTAGLRLRSDDLDQSLIELPLTGEGRVLPPCDFEVRQSNLSFGQVGLGEVLSRALEIRNRGTASCFLSAARVTGSASSPFSVTGNDVRFVEIQPGASETISVAFAPTDARPYSGELEFSISSSASPINAVTLDGAGVDAPALILTPSELSFGAVGPDCSARTRFVRLYNPGPATVRVDGFQLESSADVDFSVTRLPVPLPDGPLTVPPARSATVGVGFAAGASASAYASAAEVVGSVDGRPFSQRLALSARVDAERSRTDDFTRAPSDPVDVLIVMENSNSIYFVQDLLGIYGSAFLNYPADEGIDYQIGVTTTDVDEQRGRLCSAPAGTARQSGVFGPTQNRILTPASAPTPRAVFAANVSFNAPLTFPDARRGLLAARRALSSPAILGHNVGFIRPEAALSLVFISDEADRSDGDPLDYVNFLRSVKGFNNPHLLSASVIGAPEIGQTCRGMGGFANSAGRYLAVAEQTGGAVASICTEDWEGTLESLAPRVFSYPARFFLRSLPEAASLAVKVNGTLVPEVSGDDVNWTYDANTNSIEFPRGRVPARGAGIRLEYRSECL